MLRFLILCCVTFFPCTAQPIKAVIFDFNDVIAKSDPDLLIDFVAASSEISRERAQEALQQLWKYQEEGGRESQFWEQYRSSYDVPFQDSFWRRQWHRAKSISFKEIPGMLDLAEALQKMGFITPLFSNAKSGEDWIESVLRTGYLDSFHPLFFCCRMNVRKPDRMAFEIVLKELSLPANVCLLIDNKAENVQAAKEIGMDAILFQNQGQLVKELQLREIQVKVKRIEASNAH
jgi:putative hydrolase of the HAD superfamily